MSLFVTKLAFGEEAVGDNARLGGLIASLAAGLIGTAILVPGAISDDRSMDEHTPEPLPVP